MDIERGSMLELREHQLGVIDKLNQGFSEGHRSQLLYAPTGFGKTEVAIYLMNAYAEEGLRSAMILDRIVLVDQTSSRLEKYNITHGVYQANHWKYNTYEKIQVCSAQTLERRQQFPKIDVLVVDECHITRSQINKLIQSNPEMKVIGLTATPFTKGLGTIYSNVVCGSTTDSLVTNKWLTPLKVYFAKEINMAGAKKLGGEWSQDVVTERGMQITGDIVQEWIKMTHQIFGAPKKTIVFCAGVAHGEDLVRQFAIAGYNFVSVSYKDNSDYKREVIEDFSKPDTTIHGLIATDILTRGFDVPDVMIGVSARPFSKSLSSHIQQMGRVMRPHPEKEFALWLDHSGNYLRFRDDWDRVSEIGVQELNEEKVEKTKREPSKREKHEAKCPKCSYLWTPKALHCESCGYERPVNQFEAIAGEMYEIQMNTKISMLDKQTFYSELLYIAHEKNYNPNWASHKYKEKFGVWPNQLDKKLQVEPSIDTLNWVKHKTIAYVKAMQKQNRRSA